MTYRTNDEFDFMMIKRLLGYYIDKELEIKLVIHRKYMNI